MDKIKFTLTYTGLNLHVTVVIRKLRPKFKLPAKIEMAFSQILATMPIQLSQMNSR